uniref:Transmembrane protein n=1 Tax=Fagus sylvatica TaxID=28930 RepID=A0A2N9ETV4_FAGSY
MLCALKLQVFNVVTNPNYKKYSFPTNIESRRYNDLSFSQRQPLQQFQSLFVVQSQYNATEASEPSISSHYTSTVGSSSLSSLQLTHWNLTNRHILLLQLIASAVAVSATWLFFSAIPTLLAFKRAAESLEKLMDVTREELPDTMAAVRLSGMEISDLTMELSDLGQEITQGVRSSTRAVRLAEERLRQLTDMAPTALVQEVASPKTKATVPVLARTARGIREGVVKGRTIMQTFFTLFRFSKLALNYFTNRAKR